MFADLLNRDLILHTPSFSLSVSVLEERHRTLLFHKQNDVLGAVSDGWFQWLHPLMPDLGY